MVDSSQLTFSLSFLLFRRISRAIIFLEFYAQIRSAGFIDFLCEHFRAGQKDCSAEISHSIFTIAASISRHYEKLVGSVR